MLYFNCDFDYQFCNLFSVTHRFNFDIVHTEFYFVYYYYYFNVHSHYGL